MDAPYRVPGHKEHIAAAPREPRIDEACEANHGRRPSSSEPSPQLKAPSRSVLTRPAETPSQTYESSFNRPVINQAQDLDEAVPLETDKGSGLQKDALEEATSKMKAYQDIVSWSSLV